MDDKFLHQLLRDNLKAYKKDDAQNAKNVSKAMKIWDKQKENKDLLTWWKNQHPIWIASLHSYVFWLWQAGKIENSQHEYIRSETTTYIARSWSMPIEITTGIDNPLFDGGFFDHDFSIFRYNFSRADRMFIITYPEYPPSLKADIDLDLTLDYLSFILGKYRCGYLGFRQIISRKTKFLESNLIGQGLGPEVQMLPDINLDEIELVLSRIKFKKGDEGPSLPELLRIRHRAILDSSLESKLITLWSGIEAQWGAEDKCDFLVTQGERDTISNVLHFIDPSKKKKIIEQISKIKTKTKNDKILEGIGNLDCTNGWDLKKTISGIHSLRSKYAHGEVMTTKDCAEVNRYIPFMYQIFDELINQKLLEYNIVFSRG